MPKSPKRRMQLAAIPFRETEAGIEVLLITSRDTGRWVVPKGWPMEDKRPHRAAEIEAFEEAGAIGRAFKKAIGRYDYVKDGLVPCRVVLFALPIDRLLDEWPEDAQRERRWYTPQEASNLVAEAELADVLAKFAGVRRRRPR